MPPPHPRNPNRLNVERLEDRNPASTTLDVLLADLWLSSVAAPEPPARWAAEHAGASDRRESPRPRRLAEPSVVEPPRATPTAESSRATRSESNLNRSTSWLDGLDRGFDLPFRGVAVSAKPAASSAPAVNGVAWGVELPATSSPRTIGAPALGAIPAVDDEDDSAFAVAPMSMEDGASITLTAETNHIPVNANNTNKSKWRKDAAGADLTGLPLVRDFNLYPMRDLSGWDGQGMPPPGAAITDPDLKKMTATVTNGPGGPTWIKVSVTYGPHPANGSIVLWEDQSKTRRIDMIHTQTLPDGSVVYSGSLPQFPSCDFYVEGTAPSVRAEDITLRVSYIPPPSPMGQPPTVTDEEKLTVTPVITEFSVNPKSPDPQTTFFRGPPPTGGGSGKILGMNSGRQNADGADAGSGDQGARFTADLLITGVGGQGMFIQNVTNLINGNPSAVELSSGARGNWSLAGGRSYQISDSPNDASVPFYESTNIVLSQDRHNFFAVDTPFFTVNPGVENIVRFDLTFQARLYLTWRFSDTSVYILAMTNWQVIFKATLVNGALRVADTSVVSANSDPKYVVTHDSPGAYLGPVFNSTITFVPV